MTQTGREPPFPPFFFVVVRRVADGVVRKIRRDESFVVTPETDGIDVTFWWTDGNGSCDCNLADMFADVGGEPRPGDDEIPCGQSRFDLVGFEMPDGTMVKP